MNRNGHDSRQERVPPHPSIPIAGNSAGWPSRARWCSSGGPGRVAADHGRGPRGSLRDQAVAQSAGAADGRRTGLPRAGRRRYVSVSAPPDLRTADGFKQIKKRYADAGINVWNIGNTDVHNMPEVTLNLPGRDQKIEQASGSGSSPTTRPSPFSPASRACIFGNFAGYKLRWKLPPAPTSASASAAAPGSKAAASSPARTPRK